MASPFRSLPNGQRMSFIEGGERKLIMKVRGLRNPERAISQSGQLLTIGLSLASPLHPSPRCVCVCAFVGFLGPPLFRPGSLLSADSCEYAPSMGWLAFFTRSSPSLKEKRSGLYLCRNVPPTAYDGVNNKYKSIEIMTAGRRC
ncbi:hypothetical protein AVEN_267733-1 [Araneus ventricosus]|uniref:Uncharacterized protein n=1 Tax=Araneus ventricosus TaxID=182803 RepID=A0A4Y2CVS0_ARAVE|nr:hypothetical protein AVEN_267733-1 [Araneus ventricosus]